MLENRTREMMMEAKELMDLCVKQIDTHTIKNMSVDELDAIQRCIKLVESAGNLALEQAKMMDTLNDKLDKVLNILEKEES